MPTTFDPIVFDRNLRVLLEEEQRLEKRLTTTQDQLTAVRERIAAYRLVSQECAGVPTGSTAAVTVHEIKGMDLLDAVTLIAERHGGEFNHYQYGRILKAAGVFADDARQLRKVMNSFAQFEKSDLKGRWRLVRPSASATTKPLKVVDRNPTEA